MLQRLPTALAQVKRDNTSENLLNEFHEIIYSLYQAKKGTKKVYNNTTNSIKLQHKMDIIFMNSENSKISNHCKLLLNFWAKINLNRSDKYVAISNLSRHYTWKNIKKPYKNNKFKISAATWNKKIGLPYRSYSASAIQDYYKSISLQ